MKIKIVFFFILLIFISSCGYKVVDYRIGSKIAEIVTSGDKRISFNLKNKLTLNSNEDSKKIIKIIINTDKKKSINERNIKNEITKYSINIFSKIEIVDLINNTSKEFSISNDGTYGVGSSHSATRNSENLLIELLTNELLEEILAKLYTFSNDT